jgi:hypothetical protein
MAIDMASVYAERFRKQPDMLRAAVMGQSPDPKLDSYTALNALRLIKEADMMAMAGQAQQPTSSPSIVAEALTPPAPPQGLGAMVPGAMGQGPQGMPPQGMPPRGMPPQGMPQQRPPMPQQPPMRAASGGLAGMYTPEEDYAAGGIVAFQAGGETESTPAVTDDPLSRLIAEAGGGAPSPTALSKAQDRLDEYMNFEPKEMTAAEQEAFLDRYMARMKKAAGPDIYAPAKERLKTREGALAGDRRTGEGMALITAAGKILKGRNLAEGASEALPAYAQQMGEVKRAEQQEMRAIEQMNFALADAERKERMGDNRGAQAALAEARKFQQDANRAQGDKLRYGADIAARTVGYSKTSDKGAGANPKYQEQILQNNIDYFKSTLQPKQGETPEAFDARVRKTASDETARALKTSFSTSEIAGVNAATRLAPVEQRVNADVITKLGEFKDNDSLYRAARRAKNTTEMERLLTLEEARLRRLYQNSEPVSGGAPTTAPKPKVIKLD